MADNITLSLILGILLLAGFVLFGFGSLVDVPDRKLGLPRIGPDPGFLGYKRAYAKEIFRARGNELLREAYRKSPDTNYVVQTEDMPRIIISPKFLPEISMLPESTMSHREATYIPTFAAFIFVAICLLPGMAEHVDIAMGEFLNKVNSEDFTSISGMSLSFFTIARIFSFVFIGEPLCRNREWMQALGEYPRTMVAVSASLRSWTPWLRPFVAPFLQQTSDLKSYQEKLLKLFKPTFDERREDRNHLDALQWLMNPAAPHEADDRSMVLKLMFLTLAAVHTSSASAAHALLDLCARPEYIKSLREEIAEALRTTDGKWTTETISLLPKMDSFLQESRRMNHPSSLAIHRRAVKSVTLSDGTHIPKGWMISTFAEMLSHDDRYFDKPDVFDGDRFRGQDSKVGENNFSRIFEGNLSWGHGRFTCPGRWYADAQIKLVTAKLIERYDFRFPEEDALRPANVFVDDRISPDPKVLVEFRKLHAGNR